MKKLVFLCTIFLLAKLISAQDYQWFKDDAVYYFSNNEFFKAISIDSVVATGDSLVYYNYPAITDDPVGDCYSRFGPSWIGRYITVKSNGENIFYNKFFKPISIQAQFETNEFWTCFQFENGNYIRAIVLEIQEMEFLGLTDTVKKISFQTYDINGDTISHPINGKFILLSKNNGLIRTINFKYFPDLWGGHISTEYCCEYDLCGISYPEIGRQNLTAAQIYNFDVGDETHSERILYGNGGYSNSTYSRNFLLQKEFSTNFDTVIYLIY